MTTAKPRKAKPTRRKPPKKHDTKPGQDLVDDLVQFIGRFVVMTDEQRLVVALVVMHTHIAHLCQQTPYLFIHSPEPECGKSRLMEVLELVVARPWMIVNPSDAVLFRMVHQAMPTLLWDEIDAVFAPKSAQFHEEKRGMLDQGHRRNGRVPRFIGDKVVEFNVYCPKVFAGIGTLPETLSRRSIPIALKRRSKDEPVERFIHEDVSPDAELLRKRIEEWADEHGEEAALTRPANLPEQMSDRMQEGCFSVIALADLCGVGEPARESLVKILTGDRVDSAETMRIRLLRDMRTIWADYYRRTGKPRKAFTTEALLKRLYAIEESPWANYYGRFLEPKDVADLLRPYGIAPVLVNVPGEDGKRVRARGYRRDHSGERTGLAEVWKRYLGGDEVAEVTEVTRARGTEVPKRSNNKKS